MYTVQYTACVRVVFRLLLLFTTAGHAYYNICRNVLQHENSRFCTPRRIGYHAVGLL